MRLWNVADSSSFIALAISSLFVGFWVGLIVGAIVFIAASVVVLRIKWTIASAAGSFDNAWHVDTLIANFAPRPYRLPLTLIALALGLGMMVSPLYIWLRLWLWNRGELLLLEGIPWLGSAITVAVLYVLVAVAGALVNALFFANRMTERP